jgi:hypothetical protein
VVSAPEPAAATRAAKPGAATPKAKAVKVAICHRTNSNTNPYVQNAPSASGVFHGHDKKHEGPVWDPTLKAQGIKWGDIIPPYTYNGTDYPGQNWDAAGIAIFNAGCALPNTPPVALIPVTASAPSKTPPTCTKNGSLVIPSVAHVSYESSPSGTGPGTYTVTAFARVGYVLEGTDQWTIKVLPDLNGEKCASNDTVTPVVFETPAADQDQALPNTGGTPLWLLLLGVALTAVGAAVMLGGRRPATATGHPADPATSRVAASPSPIDWGYHLPRQAPSSPFTHRRATPRTVAGVRARLFGRMKR